MSRGLLPLTAVVAVVAGCAAALRGLGGGEHSSRHEAREQELEIYRLMVEGVTDYAIFRLDPQGRVASWNLGAERIKGYKAEEIIGQHFSVFYPAQAVAVGYPQYELEVAAREGRFEDEGWRVREDGTQFWANVVITMLRDERHGLIGFTKITRDLTERREAEERFQAVFEQAAVGMALLGLDGRWLLANARLCDMLGYTREELLERTFQDITHPEDLDADLALRRRLVSGVLGTYSMENRYVRRNGSHVWVNLTVSLARDAAGAPRYFVTVVEDFQARKETLEANEALEAFSYSVAHDLRAPLRGLQGLARAALEDVADRCEPDCRVYLSRIATTAARMDSLTQDLLTYARLSRAEIALQPVNLGLAIREALEEVSEELSSAEVVIAEGLPRVEAHPLILVQVLANLLANAAKFVPPGTRPSIEVWTEERDDRVRLWVRDNGIGIAPQQQERVFGVFERLHGVESYPGTGVGLGIVLRGMERMHGMVGVESEPGQGSRFWIELPRAE